VGHGHAPARACRDIIGVEAVHHAPIQMQAHGALRLRCAACAMKLVRAGEGDQRMLVSMVLGLKL